MISTAVTIFSLIILLFSVIIHELAHGYVAASLGDPTAKYAGRLTLNPLSHLDWFGSIIFPLFLLITTYLVPGGPFILGWAKPVPINPYNFRDQKYGEIKVSFAGPGSNLALVLVFGLMLRFIPQDLIFVNPGIWIALREIVRINIWLAVFNLIPVPPLDGSWILFNLLPQRLDSIKIFLKQYGIAILIFFILFGGSFLYDIVSFIFRLITGYSLT